MGAHIILSLGANCGDRDRNIDTALDWLKNILHISAISSIYETACAKGEKRAYKNVVVAGNFEGSRDKLEILLKQYELSKGRDDECKKRGEVPIDIDVVICGEKIIKPWDFRQKFFRVGYEEIMESLKDPQTQQ